MTNVTFQAAMYDLVFNTSYAFPYSIDLQPFAVRKIGQAASGDYNVVKTLLRNVKIVTGLRTS